MLEVSNPNIKVRTSAILAGLGFLLQTVFLSNHAAKATPPLGYQLAWFDEFDATTLDESQWLYRADEKQQSIQLPSNVEVADGHLILNLTPLDNPINGFDAAGAGVITRERFRYGYYEVRARLGDGFDDDNDGQTDEGWWHAFWAMAAEPTPEGTVEITFPAIRRTEIDAFENGSNDLTRFTQHVLAWNEQGQITARLPSGNVSTIPADSIYDWHTYGFQWTPDRVRFYVDDVFQHEAIYPSSAYEHNDVNVWLTAISTNNQSSDQERSEARYDYLRFYEAGPILVESGETLAVGLVQSIPVSDGGAIVGQTISGAYRGDDVLGDVEVLAEGVVHGTATIHGNLAALDRSTVRVGASGINVTGDTSPLIGSEDFESYSVGDTFANGNSTGLLPQWTFYDLGASTSDARFSISGADGTGTQPLDSNLTGESQMLFQRATTLDFATEAVGNEPFAGAVAVTDSFDTTKVIDIIEVDFVFDGYLDSSGVFLDTKIVFGFEDIDNWLSVSLVAGSLTGSSTQIDIIANVDGNRENVLQQVGVFQGGFPTDTLLHARVLHDSQLGLVNFEVTDPASQTLLAAYTAVDPRFQVEGLVGFAVNNDATGIDNLRVTSVDSLAVDSIQRMTIDDDYTQHTGARLEVDVASTTVHDQLEVVGEATLAGTLAVTIHDDFQFELGDKVVVFTAGESISGAFDLLTVAQPENGLAWVIDYATDEVAIEAVLGGDYNADGIVDLADYTVWRNNLGNELLAATGSDHSGDGRIGIEEYDIWRSNFGRVGASLATHAATVPEPSATSILVAPCALLLAMRRIRIPIY